jgi:hypothetical protein
MLDSLWVINVKDGNIENRNTVKSGTQKRNSDYSATSVGERNIDNTIVQPIRVQVGHRLSKYSLCIV